MYAFLMSYFISIYYLKNILIFFTYIYTYIYIILLYILAFHIYIFI